MEKTQNIGCWVLGIALALASCAPKKAIVIAEAPAVKKLEKLPAEKVVEEPAAALQQDDGLRMPDMLAMPGEGDFLSTNPGAPKTGTAPGAVIARPPTDPPSRVKPKAD